MKQILFFLSVFSMLGMAVLSNAKGYKIDVTVQGVRDTNLLLGHHFGSKKYVVDTIKVDSKGRGTFTGDSLLHKGIYLVILPSMTYFELLVDDDQEFEVSTTSKDMLKNMKFKGCDQNTAFLNYQQFMVETQTNASAIRKRLSEHRHLADSAGLKKSVKEMHKDSAEVLKSELQNINDDVHKYWDKVISENEGKLIASILKALQEVDVPDAPEGADSLFQYHYYRNHYFDNIDFSDNRLLRTPFLENKINSYLKLPVLQIPDSLIPEIDRLIGYSEKNEEMNKYMIQFFFNKLNGNEQMCMDKALYHIIDKYYMAGKAPWAENDEEFMKKLRDRHIKMMYNQCQSTAPNLALKDTLGNTVNTNLIKADYTLIYFFEPGCGHCKKIIPKWHELYQKFDKTKFKTIFVYTQTDKEEWLEFIHKHKLYDEINLYDPDESTNFRIYYDIYSTPTAYVLDKDKKIIAKRISAETISDFVTRMIEIDSKEEKKK